MHEWIPFHVARCDPLTNLPGGVDARRLYGSAYYIHPRESERELWKPKLAWLQLVSLLLVGVTAIIGHHLNWWEGRKFLEIPRALDWLVVADVLLTFLLV